MTTQNGDKVFKAQAGPASLPAPDELFHGHEQTRGVFAHTKSLQILNHNRHYIPGGVVSVNRAVQPEIVFVKGQGAYLWMQMGISTLIIMQHLARTSWDTTIPMLPTLSSPCCERGQPLRLGHD